jgi:hypothetical protein
MVENYEVVESCIFSSGIVTRLMAGESKERGSIPGTAKKFFCTIMRPYREWIPTGLLFGEHEKFLPGWSRYKQSCRQSDHFNHPSVEVRNDSRPPHTALSFMAIILHYKCSMRLCSKLCNF